MSQKKVDQYKKEKANRKQTMRKERVMGVVRTCAVTVVALALVVWVVLLLVKDPKGVVRSQLRKKN